VETGRSTLRIGVLDAGGPSPELARRIGTSADWARRLLADESYEFTSYDLTAGELPADPADCDVFVITGCGAPLDSDLAWMAPLKRFTAACKHEAVLIGLGFGHQLMADVFGGRMAAGDERWRAGLHIFPVMRRESWMGEEVRSFAAPVLHRRQVAEAPPGCRVVAECGRTSNAVLLYGDQRALSFQCRPDIDLVYARELITARRGREIEASDADMALRLLGLPNDSARIGGWIKGFIEESR
jgi:GMP synthase-like glutamine amidotransferase